MKLEELQQRARERGQTPVAPEVFRHDVAAFFGRVPEPPVYRRRDEPLRAQAQTLLDEGVELLAKATEGPLLTALEAHLEALCLVADNRIEAAEPAWQRAVALERSATAPFRLWRRSDEKRAPVFERASRTSKYDPQPEVQVHAVLACPWCRKVKEFGVSAGGAMHALTCPHCAKGFSAYFGEARSVEVRAEGGHARHVFRVEALGGVPARIEFDDGGSGRLSAASGDLLAFIYEPEGRLRGVLNLDSSRVLWLSSGPCFVATVAFGEGASELVVLRRFRDEVLWPSRLGRRLVEGYYRFGPAWARAVQPRPRARALVRGVLGVVVSALERWRSR